MDPNGIATNRWRESEWCLFPDDTKDAISAAMARSEWSHLGVVRTGFAIHLMEPHLSKGEGLRVLFERMGWSVEKRVLRMRQMTFPCLLLRWSMTGGCFQRGG